MTFIDPDKEKEANEVMSRMGLISSPKEKTMNAPAGSNIVIPTVPGTKTEIGTFFANIRGGDKRFALFQPPMAIARHAPVVWNASMERVVDAYSFWDGEANTVVMAKAGSRVAQYALDHGLYIPALDESDLRYRVLKPTAHENWCYMRSGINLNAETPLEPYTPEFPKQTEFADYREGGPEALPTELLWTSTQARDWGYGAWAQGCSVGSQDTVRKSTKLSVVLLRRLEVIR